MSYTERIAYTPAVQSANDPVLPAPLARLWGQPTSTGTGRRAQLTLEAIVTGAVGVADEAGIDALSMAALAGRLGYTTMSLYRHVTGKNELIALMVDSAVGEPSPGAERPPGGWRPQLEQWAWQLLQVIRRHPWLLAVPLAQLPVGPRRFAWLDHGLAALADTRASEHDKAAIVRLLNGYVFSEAAYTAQADTIPTDTDGIASGAALVATLVSAERYPALRHALDAGILEPAHHEPDQDFAFGLARLLDGVDQFFAAQP